MNEPVIDSQVERGAWRPRSSSSATDLLASVFGNRRAEFAFLVGIGAVTVLLHESVNWALQMPGHHGLEWMALLMFARTLSGERHAATVAAASAAALSALPFAGMNPSASVSYLLAGLVVDTLYRLMRRPGAGRLGVIAALGHVTKPLWKFALTKGATVHFGSVANGLGLTVAGHLTFGFVGGVAGALAGLAVRERLGRR